MNRKKLSCVYKTKTAPLPKFYKPYPRFIIESIRITGGGGGQTGEIGFRGRLMFLYGNNINNETGGYITFRYEDQTCRILYPGFHFSDSEQNTDVRLQSYVQGLTIAFRGCNVEDLSRESYTSSTASMGRTETTSFSIYDVWKDSVETLKVIQTKNLDSDLNDILKILRENRSKLLELVRGYPSFFDVFSDD